MDKEFIPYKESEDLKLLGFNEPCFRVLHDETEIVRPLYDEGEDSLYNSMYDDSRFVANPTYQQAFRWFRKEYKLQHSLISHIFNSWMIDITDISSVTNDGVYDGKKWDCDDDIPRTYEMAELTCLRKLIEIVNERTYFINKYFDNSDNSMSGLQDELKELSKSLYGYDIKYDVQCYYDKKGNGISLSIFDIDGKSIDDTHQRWGWNVKTFMEEFDNGCYSISIDEKDYNLNLVKSTQSLLNIILIRLGIITEIVKEKKQ